MTLHPTPITPVPEETARVAHAAFPSGNMYMQLQDILGVIYRDEQFADLFARRGRPVIPPWRLALVTVMQFAPRAPGPPSRRRGARSHRLEVCAGGGPDRRGVRLLGLIRVPSPARRKSASLTSW